MCDSSEDNVSIRSDDSIGSIANKNEKKEKFNSLLNMELKHSSVYYDLYAKNNILKVDLDNLYNSCKRLENQIKNKSELLEEYHEKLIEYQKQNKLQLNERLSSVIQKLDETNSFFYDAFDNYSSETLKNSIDYFDNETEQKNKESIEIVKKLNALQEKANITNSLMQPKWSQTSNIDVAINILFECSMKRPEIEIEEAVSKLSNEITKLEQRQEKLRSTINK